MSNKLHEFIRKNMELAATDFKMIQPGDRILVGISGGDDSFVLLKMLSGRKIYIPEEIKIIVTHIDLGFSVENSVHLEKLKSYLENNKEVEQLKALQQGLPDATAN